MQPALGRRQTRAQLRHRQAQRAPRPLDQARWGRTTKQSPGRNRRPLPRRNGSRAPRNIDVTPLSGQSSSPPTQESRPLSHTGIPEWTTSCSLRYLSSKAHRRYSSCEMRPLRYSINVTLDGCCDHRGIPVDEDLHRHAVENLDQADALLFGRVTYEMMESAWRPPTPTGTRPDWMET